MKKLVLKSVSLALSSLLLTAGLSACNSDAVKQPNPNKTPNLEGMELVLDEQFDGELDPAIWNTTPATPERRGGYWDPAQCFTQDGNLIIRTEYKEDGAYGPGWYTGTCSSRGLREFTYGYFEVRCKAPAAEGLWSAFWMQSQTMSDVTEGGKTVRKSISWSPLTITTRKCLRRPIAIPPCTPYISTATATNTSPVHPARIRWMPTCTMSSTPTV